MRRYCVAATSPRGTGKVVLIVAATSADAAVEAFWAENPPCGTDWGISVAEVPTPIDPPVPPHPYPHA